MLIIVIFIILWLQFLLKFTVTEKPRKGSVIKILLLLLLLLFIIIFQ